MFAQIDTKTVYTFMDSTISIDTYIQKGKEMGYTHLGIMDRNNLYGAYTFIEKCRLADIQPVIGCELDLTLGEGKEPVRFLMVAQTTEGYQNLMKISSARMLGHRALEDVRPYLRDVAVIVPIDELNRLEETIGEVDYYVGVYPDTPYKKLSQPAIALRQVRYFDESDLEVLQVLRAIRENQSLHQVTELPRHQSFQAGEGHEDLFLNYPDAISNLHRLVQPIHYDLNQDLKLPRFNRQRPAVEELQERSFEGLKQRGLTEGQYMRRLEEELAVIHEMGFDDYFLIVWDLLRFGRSQGYYMGMGRGSAVGSLVAYALGITGIDPVKHHLLFERFLNRERFSMPDIDIDIPDEYRPEFIRYVRDRYGSMHSAQIVTFSTFGAKQALRDVLKRFGLAEYELNQFTQKIPFNANLTSVYEKNASFRQLIHSKAEYQKAYQIALRIEGNPRQTSIHAAGIVICDEDLTDIIPLKYGEEMYITQYDAHAVEANGLLKMDFLGLRNLKFAQRMQEKIQEKFDPNFQMEKISLKDEKTIQLFAQGSTKGIFQFEQPGAIRLLRQVKPRSFEDIVATTSLNRPGASDYATNFIKRKNGQETVDLMEPTIAPILESTYGIMLYQEQVMRIAQVFAGFSLGKADILRRAMSKKEPQEMQKMAHTFFEGAKAKGHSEALARKVFTMIEKFAGYGFNRSHAYAYSALAFQLAFVKTHYPEVFYEVMLRYSGNTDYVTDALDYGFQLAPLHLNTIPYQDKFQNGKLYLGLKRIKGLSKDLALWILEKRPFQSVEDFIVRLPSHYRKIEALKPLITIGLLDDMGYNRKTVLENLPSLFVFAEALGSFFAEENYDWTEHEDYTPAEKYEQEQEILGVGISPHPLQVIEASLGQTFQRISELTPQQTATVLGQIQSLRVIRTKTKGEEMAFAQIMDTSGKVELTIFPEIYHRYQSQLEVGAIFQFKGKTQYRHDQLQLILEDLSTPVVERFWVQLKDHANDQQVAQILQAYPGPHAVVLYYQEEKKQFQLKDLQVEMNPQLEKDLAPYVLKTVYR
ncbi:DNA polymerase III subunit alpha [Streptococcus sp. DD13]|uniref:DNA polymerase III subunit alpha n=1 Tax=Streptococcus sp. DD13 TaxID=1777881 RepID=UPI00079CA6F6|nr:DNA polymerase III subunit alpha [Streptococcus sp. DD13]KXT78617.1 DNA polymerase III alpha subunit [Streptococcus sp. DD13]